MALNLLDALFQSLNSIKSGNEVCRRSLSLLSSHSLSLSLSSSLLRLSSLLRIVRIYHALLLPSPLPRGPCVPAASRSSTYFAKLPSVSIRISSRSIIEFSARFFASRENNVIRGTEITIVVSVGSRRKARGERRESGAA